MLDAGLPGSGGPLFLREACKERKVGRTTASTTEADLRSQLYSVSSFSCSNIDSSHPQFVPLLFLNLEEKYYYTLKGRSVGGHCGSRDSECSLHFPDIYGQRREKNNLVG